MVSLMMRPYNMVAREEARRIPIDFPPSSRFASLYAICLGSLMSAMWLFFIATAALLTISGAASLLRARWGSRLLLVGSAC
jgi:hypothetical protein